MVMLKIARILFAVTLFAGYGAASQAQNIPACGSLENHYGPIDYRMANKHQLSLVENAHFTQRIENLLPGGNNPWASDISYTLRVFPNHHRALTTIQKLAEREKTDKPKDAQWSVACYFDRAIRYQPNDVIVKMLYAEYLIKNSRLDEATRQLDETLRLAGDNPFTHFNIGLVFLDMKNYERALTQAHQAMQLGLLRPELKERLLAVGKWVEPPPQSDTAKP